MEDLLRTFNDYSIENIKDIRESIKPVKPAEPDPIDLPSPTTYLTEYQPANEQEVKKLFLCSPNKTCALDTIPTDLMKKLVHYFQSST